MSKVAIIYGSSRPSKVGEHVAKWFDEKVQGATDLDFELIDLKSVNLPFFSEPVPPIAGEYSQETSKQWSKQIADYDAYVFVVAEYNLSVTPILKNAVDHLFHEWADKPVAFISYGSFETSTAVEHMRTIMTPFKTKQVTETLHVSPTRDAVTENGDIDEDKISGAEPEKIVRALESLL